MKKKTKLRKPVPKKASRPMSTKKGKKGYNRKRAKKVWVIATGLDEIGKWELVKFLAKTGQEFKIKNDQVHFKAGADWSNWKMITVTAR